MENAICAAGFVNVTSINMHDLTLGILQKPSLVESISVNGDKINSGGEMYPINTPNSNYIPWKVINNIQ